MHEPLTPAGQPCRSILAALCFVFGNVAAAGAQPVPDATRGESLYSTHCIGCHGARVHWRERQITTDWAGLWAQVNRWQQVAGLEWDNADVAEVTRYLNDLHYHYVVPQ